jgi:hypothetical protein
VRWRWWRWRGEGINGLVPSLLAVIQDPGGSKRFSVAVFFFIIGACLALSLFSYVCILLLMNSARVRQHLEGAPTDQVRAPPQQPVRKPVRTYKTSAQPFITNITTNTRAPCLVVVPGG